VPGAVACSPTREHGSRRSIALLTHTGLRIDEAFSRVVAHLAYDRSHGIRKPGGSGRCDGPRVVAAVFQAYRSVRVVAFWL
jgi:hypothetical protein